jgi:hypothetical protein
MAGRTARRNCASPPEFPSLVEDFQQLVREHPCVLRHYFGSMFTPDDI